MRKNSPLLIFAFLLIALQSCVSSKLETNKDAEYTQKPRKIFLVISGSKDAKQFNTQLYNSLVRNFKKRNIVCDGFVRDPLSLQTEQDINNSINNFDPDALMVIKMTKVDMMNGGAGGGTFEISLIENKKKKTVWKGVLDVTGPFNGTDVVNSATKTIIKKLQDDQVIDTNPEIRLIPAYGKIKDE